MSPDHAVVLVNRGCGVSMSLASGPDGYSVVEVFEGARRSTLGLTYDDLIMMPGQSRAVPRVKSRVDRPLLGCDESQGTLTSPWTRFR